MYHLAIGRGRFFLTLPPLLMYIATGRGLSFWTAPPPFSLYTTTRQGDQVDPTSPKGKICLALEVDDGLRRWSSCPQGDVLYRAAPRGVLPPPVVGILRLGRSARPKALVCVRSAPLDNLDCRRRARAANVVNGPPPSIGERCRVACP